MIELRRPLPASIKDRDIPWVTGTDLLASKKQGLSEEEALAIGIALIEQIPDTRETMTPSTWRISARLEAIQQRL